jgi:chloramphenicol-sensitive protein RarD
LVFVDELARRRIGTAAGIGAYTIWGVFPLAFHQLRSVEPGEVLLHRIVWSFVFVVGLLLWKRDRRWFDQVRRRPGGFVRLGIAGVLIAGNWLTYIWAVTSEQVVQTALGYYITPLINVALGVVLLGERLNRTQLVALAFGASAVVVLTASYGAIPWIALVLAVTFGTYGFLKKTVGVDSTAALAVETAVILPVALAAMTILHRSGDAAFTNGSTGRDVLLVGLGLVTAAPLLLFGVAANRIPLSLLGLLQYLAPTLQLLCGLLILGEPLPPARLAGFVLVWIALLVLAADAVRVVRGRAPVPLAEPA